MTICSADGCKSKGAVRITEKFMHPRKEGVIMFTQTWIWCKKHDHLDDMSPWTDKDVERI